LDEVDSIFTHLLDLAIKLVQLEQRGIENTFDSCSILVVFDLSFKGLYYAPLVLKQAFDNYNFFLKPTGGIQEL